MKKILALICAAAALAACINRNHNTETGPVLKGDFTDWAQTPPMGWNSWDCYGPTVVEEEVRANADFMAKNLKKFGWEYVIVDIRWFVANDKAGGYNEDDPIYSLDEYGRYIPAVNRFPSSADGAGFKPLSDYVHSLGLKFGIHIMRGVPCKAVEQKLPILGTDGITAAAQIKRRHPEIRIILTTSMAEVQWERQAREAGVESFWYKEYGEAPLLEIMDRTMAGESVYPGTPPKVQFGWVTRDELTERELDVLRELTAGATNEEIADKLCISVNTVRTHIRNLLNKTGFSSRLDLAIHAKSLGLVVSDRDRIQP